MTVNELRKLLESLSGDVQIAIGWPAESITSLNNGEVMDLVLFHDFEEGDVTFHEPHSGHSVAEIKKVLVLLPDISRSR